MVPDLGGIILNFEYRVKDRRGKLKRGTLEAENKRAVIAGLLNQGYYILSLQEVMPAKSRIRFDFAIKPVSIQDLIVMTRQMATMLSAGLPIIKCFEILGEQTVNSKLRRVLNNIKDDIETGLAIWQAMSRHPGFFSPIYINMIRTGEMGGALEIVLDRLSKHLEHEQELTNKVRSASIYPAIICLQAIVVVLFIVTWVMPMFTGMLRTAGVDLPLPTRILLAAGNFLRCKWIFLLLSIGLAVLLINRCNKTDQGKLLFDRLFLHLPFIGQTISFLSIARFSRTMGTLVKSGIPVLQALEIVQGVVGNAVIARAIGKAGVSIREGRSIAGPLKETGVFQPMVIQLISIGEETGTLDDMLVRIADYCERNVAYAVDSMLAVIEPLLVIIVAVLVGGVVVATLLPIFNIMNLVSV